MPALPFVTWLGRVWSTRLWLLAAVLGAISVFAVAGIIHDGARGRLALGLVTQATAMHVSTVANARLERLTLETFAPAGPLAVSAPEEQSERGTIELLAHRQREGVACGCRDLLPVSQFFSFDVRRGAISLVGVDTTGAPNAQPDTALLARLARTEADIPRRTTTAASHLIVDRRLGDNSVVTLVQRDDPGSPVAVIGMIVNTRATLAALFGHDRGAAVDPTGLTQLDSLSLEIKTADGDRVFGALGSGRAHAVAILVGPLRGLQLTLALAPATVAPSLLSSRSIFHLWSLGALLAATIVAIVLAVGASRRELLLARARSDFIAGVSHDLRMPLAQILIASETLSLQRERTDADRVSLASSIVRETRRLVGLVDNVLLFSRSGVLKLTASLRPVPTDELLEEVSDAVELAVDDAEQVLEISLGPSAPVMADRRIVRQALVNLVDNALKYGTPGQRIRLGTEARGQRVLLFVADEGPGIPESERERVFEPYARLAHDQVSERTGTGLGLAVVRQIATACGGRVWIEAAPGGGTRAVLELRAASQAERAVAATHAVAREA